MIILGKECPVELTPGPNLVLSPSGPQLLLHLGVHAVFWVFLLRNPSSRGLTNFDGFAVHPEQLGGGEAFGAPDAFVRLQV